MRRAAVAVLLGGLLAGCGSSAPSTAPPEVSLKQIEAHNRAVRAGVAARTRRLEHELARRQASPRSAPAPAPALPQPPAPRVTRPPIRQVPIPFPARRKEEMAAYALRHYGVRSFALRNPKVIVEHYTQSADAQSAINTFTPDVPDVELHELPGVCSHFVIDRDGTISQLVPLGIMCRHTVGLNDTAIGIEHAGFSDRQVLSNRAQLKSSLALTRWLRCRYGIPVKDVIGHNESLASPYHHERVPRLRSQTHSDWTRADMEVYRARLAALGCHARG